MFHAIPRSRGRFKRPAQLLEGLKAPKTAGWWEGEHGHGWKRMTKGRREFKMFVLGGFFNTIYLWMFSVQKSMVVTDLKGVKVSSTLVTYVFHPTWPGIPRGHRIHVWYCLPTWNPWNQLKKVRVKCWKNAPFPIHPMVYGLWPILAPLLYGCFGSLIFQFVVFFRFPSGPEQICFGSDAIKLLIDPLTYEHRNALLELIRPVHNLAVSKKCKEYVKKIKILGGGFKYWFMFIPIIWGRFQGGETTN